MIAGLFNHFLYCNATVLASEFGNLATFANYSSLTLSQPWDWLLRPEIITYCVDPHYAGMISPNLWAFIIPVTLYTVYKTIKKNAAAVFSILRFICLYLLWIQFSLLSDRISYIYYFYPAIGSICLVIGV